uniref:Tetraspanin n=1 Tax=Acanthochromis polyacanthus TaxID=80966 RepID=A0A3Q1FEX9_9TELE
MGSFIKYLLATFNFLFYVGVVFILGCFVNIRINRADHQIIDDLLPAIDLVLFIGVGAMIFGCLDHCATIRKNRCPLALFFLGLLTMFVMLLAVGVLGAISRTAAAQELVRERMEQFLPLSEQPEDFQESFGQVERTSFCCGFFAGHLDWGNSMVVPNSCDCIDTSVNCMVLDGLKTVRQHVSEMARLNKARSFSFIQLTLVGAQRGRAVCSRTAVDGYIGV